MITDYSPRFSSVPVMRKQILQPKVYRKSQAAPGAWVMMKAVGLMVIVTLVLGVSSTFWYGWQIRSALNEIGDHQAVQKKLSAENKLLMAQRDRLMTRESIEAAAKKLGFYPPAPEQIRKP